MPDPAVNTLSLIILLVGMICVLGVVLWRGQLQKRESEQKLQEFQERLETSFSLGGYLLGAQDEKVAVLAAMRAGQNVLEADGYAFVPLNEWTNFASSGAW